MALSSEILVETARYLEQHDEGQRAKKLVFCLCKKYWENDPNVLNSQSLESLLLELIQIKPSIEQLTFSLYKLVKTLNRPKVYAAVAKMILDRLGPIYAAKAEEAEPDVAPAIEVESVEQPTGFNPPLVSPTPSSALVASPQVLASHIAQNLSQHPEAGRIEKLMFAVGKGYWENSLDKINQYGFVNLILELRQRYPYLAELRASFEQIVNNINKATLYLAIANVILQQMEKLYEDSLSFAGNATPEPALAVVRRDAGHQQTAIVNFPAPARSAEPLLTVLGTVPVPNPPASKETKQDYNLFDLRSEIMQYANPLRAKILLFSILFHSWNRNGQDWGMLRSYGLDDLIEQVILSQRPCNEVELKLYAQAKEMPEAEAYTHTATTLMKVLKPLL
ncbi:hypothetical protein [Synechocystis sp. LKSZ1]|uniref:hypothetical protein n=1 Tax=Synechocystis sp. LKSZ1 TaxID=3144951 RepID=UPI00336BE0EC